MSNILNKIISIYIYDIFELFRVWDVDLSDEELLETYPVGATILGSNFTETNTLVTIAQDTQHQINGS